MQIQTLIQVPKAKVNGGMKENVSVSLRKVLPQDLDIFFDFQRDPAAVQMAAFTAKDPNNRQQFDGFWQRILNDPEILIRTVRFGDSVAGSVLSHAWFGDLEISYWIGRPFWGQGIATRSLELFLVQQKVRPIYARAAKDNYGSIRVLEKCGFRHLRDERGFANARGEEIDEVVMVLEPK